MPNTLRDRIVEEAKTWIHTPYRDHAGLKGYGVDCGFFPVRTLQAPAVGILPFDLEPPPYSPQKWLNRPQQANAKRVGLLSDKRNLRFEDRTYIEMVIKYAKSEIWSHYLPEHPELPVIDREPLPGDFVIYKVVASWTHGGFVVRWPEYVIHPIVGLGVIGSHGLKTAFLEHRHHRFFSFVEEA